MPAQSKAQYRAMQAAQQGHSTLGISKVVGKDFVKATGSPQNLPERKASKAKGSRHERIKAGLAKAFPKG